MCVGSENSLVECAVSDQLLADCRNTLSNAYISCQGVSCLSYSCHDGMDMLLPPHRSRHCFLKLHKLGGETRQWHQRERGSAGGVSQ